MRTSTHVGSGLKLSVICLLSIMVILCAAGLVIGRQTSHTIALRFEVSISESVRKEATDGRIFVMVAKTASPEPRFQVTSYDSTPFFGANVDGLRPGQAAVVDNTAYGYPFEHLSELPAGDYYVQGM